MARIDYADPDAEEARTAAAAVRARRAGNVPNLFKMLLHSPAIAERWLDFMTAVRSQSVLDGRTREIVILRTAAIVGAEYPIVDHIPIALKDGMTRPEIDAVIEGDASGFSAREKALIAFVEASTREVQVPDAVFDALGAHYTPREVVEITVLNGAYNMVARFLEAMRIDLEA
jgi:alkylhydroperoxidase family enzyme